MGLPMPNLTLYTNPRSRGRLVRWMLEEVGEPYETRVIEYGAAMKAPVYLAINPMGKVPAIQHGDQIVTECAAICMYLAEAFAEAGLKPATEHLGAYYRWLSFTSGPFESAINDFMLGFSVPEQYEVAVGYGNYDRAVNVLANHLSEHEFVAGSKFSAADVYVGSHVHFSLENKAIQAQTAFTEYVQRVTNRDAFHRVIELDGFIDSK